MTQSALLEFHNSREISKKDYQWKLNARVISLWNVPEHMLPLSSSSMDLVLIDREGMKFEASICKSHPILPKIVEGCVYQISFFRIIDNIGPKRFTSTKYRLFFHACTKIYPVVNHKIPKNGWDFFHMDHIKYYGNTFGYLADVVGILSAASSEKLLIKDSRIYKSMDKSGMNKCFLVGDIVDTISEYLCSNWVTRPVVALLFVEVRKNNGVTQVHVVPYVTKILINPKFEEDSVLADRFDGMNSNLHVDFISSTDKKVDIHAELLELHPKKTIPELLLTKQKGIFVVHAGIVSMLKDSAFFYPSCRCFTELERGDDVYRCNRCFRVIEKFIHRYSFKLEVYDGVDSCVFLLKDHEAVQLIGISCEELMNSKENPLDREYPAELEDKIVGKELLFKIRAGFGITYNCQEIYEAKFAPPFTQLQDVHDSTKVEEKHVAKHKYTSSVAARFNMGMNSYVVVGQSSSTTVIHSSLKRKLEAEF
ncbi:uncharacterized protein LOC130725287 [Lotus japonicus]|uniref:uncharacterized protein LOC130725287 n=1 Tax=Lotus japonicus TaxID=34305 RepID=UPI002583682A|nr:uncharacterized protein LOC130725287 [Lotus japonicus]